MLEKMLQKNRKKYSGKGRKEEGCESKIKTRLSEG
jgi:hypothetical protein